MTDVPKETLESARQMVASFANKIIALECLASLSGKDRELVFDQVMGALDFAYQEGYGDGKEDAK